MKIEGILLDLDNTLYDYQLAHTPALNAALSWISNELGCSLEETEAAYRRSRRHINQELSGLAASHSRLLYFQYMCEQLRASPYRIALAAEEVYWSTFFDNMHLRTGCLNFLKYLKPLPVAIVSDLTSQVQFRKIVRLGLESYLNAIITSEEAGHEKPHPRIFELSMRKLSIQAPNLCMIGDSWERDIQGALNLGIQAYWLRADPTSSAREENNSNTSPSESIHSARVQSFFDFSELSALVSAHV